MNIKLIAIGKTDNKNLQSLIDEYQKRLSFYIKFDLEIIPDIKNVKNLSESQQKEKEGELILAKITPTDQLILLDENGKTFSSVGFSEELQKKITSLGYRADIFNITISNSVWYSVRIGYFDSFKDAKLYKENFFRQAKLKLK